MTSPFHVSAKTATAVLNYLSQGADPTAMGFFLCAAFLFIGAVATAKG